MDNDIYVQAIEKEYKSKMIVGNVTMFCTKRFNLFQKKMLKIFFGIEVLNYER